MNRNIRLEQRKDDGRTVIMSDSNCVGTVRDDDTIEVGVHACIHFPKCTDIGMSSDEIKEAENLILRTRGRMKQGPYR